MELWSVGKNILIISVRNKAFPQRIPNARSLRLFDLGYIALEVTKSVVHFCEKHMASEQ